MAHIELPLYEQARQDILGMIQADLRTGDLLPTQGELSERLGASLITIKRALSELARDGIVESIRGRGTIVKGAPITDRRQGVSSWTDSITGLGEKPQTGWSTFKRIVPNDRIRHQLNLKARQNVVQIQRLRLVGGKPICLMTNCLPGNLVPDLETTGFSGESLYQCLRERYEITFAKANEIVKARSATADEKKQLGDDANVVLEIERLSFDSKEKPIECAQVIAHADHYTYQMQLINNL